MFMFKMYEILLLSIFWEVVFLKKYFRILRIFCWKLKIGIGLVSSLLPLNCLRRVKIFYLLLVDNSDLDLTINTEDMCSAKAMSQDGFAHLWAGVRATHGATKGKSSQNSGISKFILWAKIPNLIQKLFSGF